MTGGRVRWLLLGGAVLALGTLSCRKAEPTATPFGLSIRTESGLVQGVGEPGIRIFRGIPYAAPPVGPLRWRPPQPAAPWEGMRAGAEFGASCPQTGAPEPMTEDCLTLNIWAPDTPSENSGQPVMVWIHGGRLPGRQRIGPGESRRPFRPRRGGPGHPQLPPRSPRVSRPLRARRRPRRRAVGQLRPSGHGGRARVGEAQHRGVRGRSLARDDLRRVRRGHGDPPPDGRASGTGALSPGDRHERLRNVAPSPRAVHGLPGRADRRSERRGDRQDDYRPCDRARLAHRDGRGPAPNPGRATRGGGGPTAPAGGGRGRGPGRAGDPVCPRSPARRALHDRRRQLRRGGHALGRNLDRGIPRLLGRSAGSPANTLRRRFRGERAAGHPTPVRRRPVRDGRTVPGRPDDAACRLRVPVLLQLRARPPSAPRGPGRPTAPSSGPCSGTSRTPTPATSAR